MLFYVTNKIFRTFTTLGISSEKIHFAFRVKLVDVTKKFHVIKGVISYMNTAKRLLCVSQVLHVLVE